MKKLLLLVTVLAMVLSGCGKINDELDALGARIDKLEQETIPTIDEQISAINTTLDNLDAMDKELKGYIDGLQATADNLQEQINATSTKIDAVKAELQGEISAAKAEVLAELEALETELKNELAQINATIETLQAKDEELDNKIADLKTYVDTELKSTKDWVNATFATLEQLNALSSEVATLKNLVEANKAEAAANLANAISTLETSLKAWVGEQLSNYYTIAEIDAKIAELQKAITDGNSALQQQLNELKSQLETAKAELTEAYKKAIEEAIETNNGVIDQKIASEIAAVNKRIDEEVAAINAKIATLQAQVDKNTEDIAKLLARIQSVSYIPTYSDGKATLKCTDTDSLATLDFEISPKDAVAELAKVWDSAVSLKAIYTQTRAVEFVDMPIITFEADTANGVISITASGENLSEEFFAGKQEASVRLDISDGNNSVTSEYVAMTVEDLTTKSSVQYKGSWTVINTESGEISYQESDVTIDVEIPDVTTAKFNIILNRIRFADVMPKLTMKLSGISFSTSISENEIHLKYIFEHKGVVPTIGDISYEDYKMKSLKGCIGLDVEIEFEFENKPYTVVFTTKK